MTHSEPLAWSIGQKMFMLIVKNEEAGGGQDHQHIHYDDGDNGRATILAK